jgi:hypothetical protein
VHAPHRARKMLRTCKSVETQREIDADAVEQAACEMLRIVQVIAEGAALRQVRKCAVM